MMPEGFTPREDGTFHGIPEWCMCEANAIAASFINKRPWDVPCLADAIFHAYKKGLNEATLTAHPVARAALPADLRAGHKWAHTKTGNVYEVITISNLNSTKDDFVPTVVYRDKDNVVWSRPVSEFVEKFEPNAQ